jgi:hypothetical protein
MNDFVPRIESVSADRSVLPVRPVPAVAPIQPSSAAAQDAGQNGVGSDSGEQARREHMASASDYARVQARIADILADMSVSMAPPETARSNAATALSDLRPGPTVIIPLPPASKEAIEHAVQLARSMAQQAALTRTAQANVGPGTVDQLLSMSA